MPEFDYDVIVIGSGFGGSVSALRLTEKGYSVGVLEAGRRWDPEDLPKTNWQLRQVDLGAEARPDRHAADQPARQVHTVQRGRGRRRVAHLRQHALRAARQLLERPALGAHHRLEVRTRAVLRPGQAHARRRDEPPRDCPRTRSCSTSRRISASSDTYHRTNVGVFFGEPGVDGGRSVLRRRRTRTLRVHPLRALLHRLSAQRQEHHDDELPVPRRTRRVHRSTR